MFESIAKGIVLSTFVLCAGPVYSSQEDSDLDSIPQELIDADRSKQEENSDPARYSIRIKADDLFEYTSWRDPNDLIVSVPGYDKSDWNNLARVGVRGEFSPTSSLNIHADALLNIYLYDDEAFKSSKDIQFNVKELYLSWSASPSSFVDAGRINIKNGVASGFNPTDYFKTNAVISRNTQDISQLRDNRLGTFALRAQKLWDSGVVSLVAAPDMGNDLGHWYSDEGIYGLNMQKTNDRSRLMIKFSQRIIGNFSPELIYYNESGDNNFGVNLSHSINDNLIVYSEWNIGERRSLLDEALFGLRQSQQIRPELLENFPQDEGKKYQHQLAVGATYTTASNITTNLEYHYNQAGLSDEDWRNWFRAGEAARGDPWAQGQLLSVRGLAQSRVEPANEHSLFLRSQWQNALITNLNLVGLFLMDLEDQSSLVQAEAAYNLNSQSSVSLRVAKFIGDRQSSYGSLFTDLTAILQYNYNF
jgi:hypothetical protein